MAKENQSLRRLNERLNQAVNEERIKNEQTQKHLENEQKELAYKLQLIETGCGRELVLRLKNLRDQIFSLTNSSHRVGGNNISYAEDSVDNMAKEISSRVKQLIKQRETLQNAVNTLQKEKQEMF